MKVLVALVMLFGWLASAAANDYRLEHRPELSFKNGPVHVTPYPQSGRTMTVWNRDACWRDCKTDCTARMIGCTGETGADTCRPHFDACERACQRSCRSPWQGPLLGFVDW